MALLKTIWLLIKKLFSPKPKLRQTVLTREDILAYAAETPHIRNSVKKTIERRKQESRAEVSKAHKRKIKNKAQRKARKNNR